jgi:putative DNA primase/helicase
MMPQVADVYLADADKLRSLMSATMAPLAMVKDVPPEIGSWTSPIAAAVKELRAAAGKIKNLRGIESALTLAQSHLRVPDDAWDRDPYLLSVPNGVVDLRTSELLPPVPAQRITKMAGAIYDPCAKSEVFQKFLEQVQPDPKMRDYLQRLAGYSAVGMANEQKFFVFVGGGANGKGTYGGVTMDALGAYAVKAPMGMLAQHDAGRPRNDLAMLAGARLVSISETPENLRIDEATIKAMTGQDEISARYLHQEFFKFRPCFSPILDTNHAPRPRESGEAIWRRLVIVPWTVIIPGEMRDQHLREKLLEELPGILAWIVAGAKKYLEEGLPPTPEITESTRAHRSSCDEMGRWLECCVEHTPHSSTQSTALYEEFLSWNHAEGIELPISRRKFTERLRDEFGFEVSKSHGVMVWRGIGLRDRRTAPNTPDIHGREGLKGVSAIVEAIISSQPATVVSPVHAPVQALQRMSSGGSIVC